MAEDDDLLIEDPRDLLRKRLDFIVFVENAILPENHCTDSFVEYSIINEEGDMQIFKTNTVFYLYNEFSND